MVGGPEPKGAPHAHADDDRAQEQDLFGLDERERLAVLAWVGEDLPYVRRSVFGHRLLYWSLAIGFAIGLAFYIAGYLLKSSATTEPLGLVGDLLYTLGWALWTGVVVAVFIQVIPEVKQRQFKQALDAYEASQREEASAGSDEPPMDRRSNGRRDRAASDPG